MKKQKSFFNEKSKGFTLAEILMISAIVALIGSVILIFSKGAIEKARIAKLLQFSANIHHALGAYLIAEYKFEETGYGTCPNLQYPDYDDFCDTSGNGYHGQKEGVVSQEPNDEIPQLGQAGYFNGGDIKVLPRIDSFLTIQAWIKPAEFPIEIPDFYRFIIGSVDSFAFYINEEKKLCFQPLFCSNNPVFEIGKWYHVVATYGKSEVKLFVNAEEVGLYQFGGTHIVNTGALRIGGGFVYTNYKGYIDELRIYSEALSSAQIRKLYAEGAKKHGLLFKE